MRAAVNDTAIYWAVRMDGQSMDAEEQRSLDEWLSADDRHRGALFRARAGLVLMGTLEGEAPVEDKVVAPARSRRWSFVALAAAASIAAVFTLSWSMRGQEYQTDVGEVRRIALADGSVALINTQSDIAVRYDADKRAVRLDAGEAWFSVARNKAKPFIVDAGNVEVQATGTAFSVRRRDEQVEIVVTEGSVRAWRRDRPGEGVAISAGHSAWVSTRDRKAPIKVASVGDRVPLAWREGGIALNETTVGEAAEEFNRYNAVKISVENKDIASRPMTGYFLMDRPDQFSRAVSDLTGAKAYQIGNKYIIE